MPNFSVEQKEKFLTAWGQFYKMEDVVIEKLISEFSKQIQNEREQLMQTDDFRVLKSFLGNLTEFDIDGLANAMHETRLMFDWKPTTKLGKAALDLADELEE